MPTGEEAKAYAQLQGEMDMINRGAAFANSTRGSALDSYSLGSYGQGVQSVNATIGAGEAIKQIAKSDLGSLHEAVDRLAQGARNLGGNRTAEMIGTGMEGTLHNAVRAGMMEGIQKGARMNVVGSMMETEEARALGSVMGAGVVGKAKGALAADATTKEGYLDTNFLGTGGGDDFIRGTELGEGKNLNTTSNYGLWADEKKSLQAGRIRGTEMAGADVGTANAVDRDRNGWSQLFDGAERTARVATNKTIGAGEAVLTDQNGRKISEERFMGDIKAGAAMGFLSEGLKGAADRRYFHESWDGTKRLNASVAKGIYGGERSRMEAAEAAGKEIFDKGEGTYFANVEANAREKEKAAQAHGRNIRKEFGGTGLGKLENILDPLEKKKIDSMIGESIGVMKNLMHNPNIYKENAEYGEQSKEQGIQAKIAALGSISEALALDTVGAAIKAAEDKGALKGKIKEYVRRDASRMGLDPEEIADSVLEKGIGGSFMFGSALTAAGDISAMKSGRDAAFADQQFAMYSNAAANEKMVDSIIGRSLHPEKVMAQMMRAGLIDRNGKVAEGASFVAALGRLRAGDMERDKQLVIGGERFNVDRDIDGNVLIDNSTMESTKRGRDFRLGVKGYLGDTGATMAEMAIAGYSADRVVKHYTGRGIFERFDALGDRARSALGLPPKDESVEKAQQGHHSHSAHNVNKNSAQHGSSPSVRSYLNPNSNTNTAARKQGIGVGSSAGTKGKKGGIPGLVGSLLATWGVNELMASNNRSDSGAWYEDVLAAGVDGAMVGSSAGVPGAVAGALGKAFHAIVTAQPVMNQGGLRSHRDQKFIEYVQGQLAQGHTPSPRVMERYNAMLGISDPGHQSTTVANQAAQFQQNDRMVRALENMEQLRQLSNPVAPAPGGTIQTAGGGIPVGTTPSGYLKLGDMQTHIPMADFRNYMQNPQNAQQFAQYASAIQNPADVFENFNKFEKRGTDRVETLLDTMKFTAQKQTGDQRVGLSTLMDYNEQAAEYQQAMAEKLEKIASALGADKELKIQ